MGPLRHSTSDERIDGRRDVFSGGMLSRPFVKRSILIMLIYIAPCEIYRGLRPCALGAYDRLWQGQ